MAALSSGAVLVAITVLASEGSGGAKEVSLEGIWTWLLGMLSGGALGYFAKWLLEQFSARAAARRKFAEQVTEKISELADQHYWKMANYAGVVAGQLEGYLEERTYQIIQIVEERQQVVQSLDYIVNKYANEEAVENFSTLTDLLYNFQFEESNTYILTDHAAGEHCKRLYNLFRGCFAESPPRNETELAEWLRYNVADVTVAAYALRAFNELLNHELANLYEIWFKKRQPDRKPYAEELSYGVWPNVLTERAFAAIDLAAKESTLYRPLEPPKVPLRRKVEGEGELTRPPGKISTQKGEEQMPFREGRFHPGSPGSAPSEHETDRTQNKVEKDLNNVDKKINIVEQAIRLSEIGASPN